MSNLDLLGSVDILSGLNPQQIQSIYNLCKEVAYYQGEVIFPENSTSTDFFILLEGEVEISINPVPFRGGDKGSEPLSIAMLHKGQSFGEVALVDRGVRSASARCISTSCKVLIIHREDFIFLMNSDHEIGYKVMTNLATDLCSKLRQNNNKLRDTLM